MKGWKTKLGAALVMAAGVLKTLSQNGVEPVILGPIGDALFYLGGALTAVGLGHKIEKGAL